MAPRETRCSHDQPNQKKLSLWLLPPEPLRSKLQKQIDDISARSGGRCPAFLPHVTVWGGVPCPDQDEADAVLARLRDRLDDGSFGRGVPCRFGETEVTSVRNEDGAVKWNQSCIAVVERSLELLRAVRASRPAFFPSEENGDVEDAFKPPLREPHYSLAYGNDPGDCAGMKAPPDFDATEAVLMWTYPATLEGVRTWEEIGRIRFC